MLGVLRAKILVHAVLTLQHLVHGVLHLLLDVSGLHATKRESSGSSVSASTLASSRATRAPL
ncbi:hypothetical protein PF004_g25120 [Phytophthora fragariae]|uniref:Uncharacterized protein n=1 Tax=Phytophthora fragariae TaxID=53985 RepID=A0A6G0MTC6_9STRA|nr:hypothetical protein PF004_g25120 [Phytophthora fragariae]